MEAEERLREKVVEEGRLAWIKWEDGSNSSKCILLSLAYYWTFFFPSFFFSFPPIGKHTHLNLLPSVNINWVVDGPRTSACHSHSGIHRWRPQIASQSNPALLSPGNVTPITSPCIWMRGLAVLHRSVDSRGQLPVFEWLGEHSRSLSYLSLFSHP